MAAPGGRGRPNAAGEVSAVDQESLLLRVNEVAVLLRVGRWTVYELIRRGELPALRIGRLVRVPRHGLEAWVRRSTSGTEAMN
jgi:putative molybdopterin biosynthesis protein